MGLLDWFATRKEQVEETPSLRRLCYDLEADMARERREMEQMRADVRRMLAKVARRAEREVAESLHDAPESNGDGEGHPNPAEIFRRNQLLRRGR